MKTRTCIHCLKLKELEHGFYFISRSQTYETRCKICVRTYTRARNKRDGGKSVHRCYLKRKSEGKIAAMPYAEKTPAQRKIAALAVKKWRANNHERFTAESRQGIQMRGSLAHQKAWPLIVAHYGGRCLNCGSSKRLCFDHVVPLSRGGPNILSNGQPLCRKCNAFKGQIQDGTNGSRDYRPDQGAWIAELVELNPWLMVIVSGHKQGWHKTAGGVAYWNEVKRQADEGIRKPGSTAAEMAVIRELPPVTMRLEPSLAQDLALIVAKLNEKAPVSPVDVM